MFVYVFSTAVEVVNKYFGFERFLVFVSFRPSEVKILQLEDAQDILERLRTKGSDLKLCQPTRRESPRNNVKQDGVKCVQEHPGESLDIVQETFKVVKIIKVQCCDLRYFDLKVHSMSKETCRRK